MHAFDLAIGLMPVRNSKITGPNLPVLCACCSNYTSKTVNQHRQSMKLGRQEISLVAFMLAQHNLSGLVSILLWTMNRTNQLFGFISSMFCSSK